MFFDPTLARQSIPPLLHGLQLSLEYTVVIIILSLLGAFPVALARMSRRRLIRGPVGFYIEVFRTTPLLIQLVYIYYALPQIGIELNVFEAGVLGMVLHYVAFIAQEPRVGKSPRLSRQGRHRSRRRSVSRGSRSCAGS